MDNDQKLVTLLDSLGEGTDVGFAREVLEAHGWDLEAALNMLTAGAGSAAQSNPGPHGSPGAEQLDAEGYRAPMRTGYRDTLMGPEPGGMPWELAFAAAQGNDSSGRPMPPDQAGSADGLEQVLHASRSEHQRRMDAQEQGALAEAFQASWSNYEEEELRRRSQQLQAQSEEQKSLARAIEASYREQAGTDNSYRTELERAMELSRAEAPGAFSSPTTAQSGLDHDLELALQLSAKDAQQASSRSSHSKGGRQTAAASSAAAGRSEVQSSLQAVAPRFRKLSESSAGPPGNAELLQRAAPPRLRKPSDSSLGSPGSSELLQRAGAATAASSSNLPERKISTASTATAASSRPGVVGKLGAASRQGTTAFPQPPASPPRLPSSSSRDAAAPAAAARSKAATPTPAPPLRPGSRGSAAGSVAGSAAVAVRADRQRGAVPGSTRSGGVAGAPGQAAATLEAFEADMARRKAEEKERSLRKPAPEAAAPAASVAVAAAPSVKAEEPAPAAPATVSSRAEALAAAESRRREAAEAAQVEERLKTLATEVPESSAPSNAPSQPVQVAEAPAAVEAASTTAKVAPGDKEAVTQALIALRRQHLQGRAAELLLCLRTLRAYVGNLASKPHEPKFQRIGKDNAAFSSRVACLEGATDILVACGFAEQPEAWEMDPGYLKKKGPALFDALAKIDVMLDQVQAKASAAD